MTAESSWTRFSHRRQGWLDRWSGTTLSSLTIPCSEENLRLLNRIGDFPSNHFQRLAHYSHDHYDIRLLLEPWRETPISELASLDLDTLEKILSQFLILDQACQHLNLAFIDRSRLAFLPDQRISFPLALPPKSTAAGPSTLLHRLVGIPRLNQWRNCSPSILLDQLKNRQRHDVYSQLYRYPEFAANLITSYSFCSLRSEANLTIGIHTQNDFQTRIISEHLYSIFEIPGVLPLKLDLAVTDPRQFLMRLLGSPQGDISIPELAAALHRFLKKTAIEKLVLIADHLEKPDHADFFTHLLELSAMTNVIFITFSRQRLFDYDLELNENPPNLLLPFLPLHGQGTRRFNKSHDRPLKILHVLNRPVSQAEAAVLFPGQLDAFFQQLIADEIVNINPLAHTFSIAPAVQPPKISASEKRLILEHLRSKVPDQVIAIQADWQKGDRPQLIKRLQHYQLTAHRDPHFHRFQDVIRENSSHLKEDSQLCELAVTVLINGHETDMARQLLLDWLPGDSPFRKIKMAAIGKLDRDYEIMRTLLDNLSRIPTELADENHYLRMTLEEKTGQQKKADHHWRKIRQPFFLNLGRLDRTDRLIYGGKLNQAEAALGQVLNYFRPLGHLKEELEVLSQLAKLRRVQQRFPEAEQIYQEIFITSETSRFTLQAAYFANDLGNLYQEIDKPPLAEIWYRKALKLFTAENHGAGILLAQSNMVDIAIARGNWLEAEQLQDSILRHDEKKGLLIPQAIDHFNLAFLTYLRHDFSKARQECEKAAALFARTGNIKGGSECRLLEDKIRLLTGEEIPAFRSGLFDSEQKRIRHVLEMAAAVGEKSLPVIRRALAGIRSKKSRFDLLIILIKKTAGLRPELLEQLKNLSAELSGKEKNYFFFEYQYLRFESLTKTASWSAEQQQLFHATRDFFGRNQRQFSTPILALKSSLDEADSRKAIFDSARLVRSYQNWKIPEDFFASFCHEIGTIQAIEWICLHVFVDARPAVAFANRPGFFRLAEELLEYGSAGAEEINWQRKDLQRLVRSEEKAFYPWPYTKLIRWKISENLHAWLLLGFSDADLFYRQFAGLHRLTLDHFAGLFQRFYEKDFQLNRRLDFIIGRSPAIGQLKRLIAKVAQVDFSLLICGESGSGKELVARAVHMLSPRAERPFVSVNSAAIPEPLLEAELFGFRKGAFTGAGESRIGLIETADGGTLFLDEIADLPLKLQAKLLRVLQENEIRRLGENKTISVNIRLISATNKDLHERIKKNLFREDLFYRLQDLTVNVPPLRERREDIPLLVEHFLRKYNSSDLSRRRIQEIVAQMRDAPFAGNVRELESKIKRLITFDFEPDDDGVSQHADPDLKSARDNFERSYILQKLRENGWNRSQTSSQLGISRMSLFNLIKKYQIDRDDSLFT